MKRLNRVQRGAQRGPCATHEIPAEKEEKNSTRESWPRVFAVQHLGQEKFLLRKKDGLTKFAHNNRSGAKKTEF